MTPEGKVKAAIRKYLKTVNNCYAFTQMKTQRLGDAPAALETQPEAAVRHA